MVFNRKKKSKSSDGKKTPAEKKAIDSKASPRKTCNVPMPGRGAWAQADTRTLVVVGDGLAAGMGSFSLMENYQSASYPALLAAAMGTKLLQPLFQEPGLGYPIGFANVHVAAPTLFQTTVFKHLPTELPGNLGIPGFSAAEALHYRPEPPLLDASNVRSIANLILAAPGMKTRQACFPTQAEAANQLKPSMLLVQLGYDQVLNYAINGEGDIDAARFEDEYAALLDKLSESGAKTVLMTVPSPTDTAYYTLVPAAAEVLKVELSVLTRFYGLGEADYLTPEGIIEIGYQIQTHVFAPLSPKAVLHSWQAVALAEFSSAINEAIHRLGESFGFPVFPLHEVFADLKRRPLSINNRPISGNYLGGVFNLNGTCPGHLGNGLIAERLLGFLSYYIDGANFTPINLKALQASDPVAGIIPAVGKPWTYEQLAPVVRSKLPQTTSGPAGVYNNRIEFKPLPKPLQLPDSLEITMALNSETSYHADAMTLVNTNDPRNAMFGNTRNLLFGGLAFFGSQLKGTLHFRFTAPVNNKTHFVLTFSDGSLTGTNGDLACPNLYRFPIGDAKVFYPPNTGCEGDLDLVTGFGSNMKFFLFFQNTGLGVLAKLNPTFPRLPIPFTDIEIKEPPVYATAFAQFTQKSDGGLDFVFHGTSFVPLGPNIKYPLPIASAAGDYATIASSGTALHPNIHLSTVLPLEWEENPQPLKLQENTTIELTAATYRTSFGDDFTLNNPSLGLAEGRSPLTGRVQIQFGTRFGDFLGFNASILPPTGLFEDPTLAPLQDSFPAALSRGLLGHNEFLKFPNRQYYLDNVYFLEDPFDLALGAINLRTGQVVGDFLHRGLIGQNLIFALVRVEPRTPQATFQFRGPARFNQDEDGALHYRFSGTLFIPYPEGFLFPAPDLATGVVIGDKSQLDPFLDLDAYSDLKGRPNYKDARKNVAGSTGGTFSYSYDIPAEPGAPASFTFVDHQMADAGFTMFPDGLMAAKATNTGSDVATLTFTGNGRWSPSPDEVHTVSVQVSFKPEHYISILIDGGMIDNVTTAPDPNHKVLP